MGEKTFISYARKDGDFARRLAHDLRAANVDLWMDKLDIRPGDTWDRAVEEALQECTGLLVVLSPDAVASRSVMDEVSYALEENRRVIPVIYKECKLPFRLRRVQYTDLTSDYDLGLSALIRALGGTPPIPAGHGSTGADEPRTHTAGGSSPQATLVEPEPIPSVQSATPAADAGRPRAGEDPDLRRGPAGPLQAAISQPPRPGASSSPWMARLGMAVILGTGSVLFVGIVEMLGGSSLSGRSLEELLSRWPMVAVVGVPWAIAGAIAGPRRVHLGYAAVTSTGFLIGSLLIGRDFSLYLLWPLGGLLGAVLGAVAARRGAAAGRRKTPEMAAE